MNVYKDDYSWTIAETLQTLTIARDCAAAYAERYPRDPEYAAAYRAAEQELRDFEAWVNGTRGSVQVSK